MTDFDPNAHLDFEVDTLSGMVPVRSVVFSVGSNLGDRLGYLQGAVEALRATPTLTIVGVSSVYETAPVGGPADQPDYANAVLVGSTDLEPHALLAADHPAIAAALDAFRQRQTDDVIAHDDPRQ